MRRSSSKRVNARVFKKGRSQAVRLPKEFRFDGDTVLVHRDGSAVMLEPAREWPAGWIEFVRRCSRRLRPSRSRCGCETTKALSTPLKSLLDTDTCIDAL